MPHQCWILTDGKAGMLAPARGLAMVAGFDPCPKRLRGGFPWRFLPAAVWPPGVMGLSPRSDILAPPWPDVVISCGRHAVGPALEVKRRSAGATLAVHIQHPHVPPGRFDLVIAPAHDRLQGPNVEVVLSSLHELDRAMLDRAAAAAAAGLADVPQPRICVLLGGSNGAFRLDPATAMRIGEKLRALARTTGGGLLISPSRRTGETSIRTLRESLGDTPHRIWDMCGKNPYHGWLGLADAVLVTGDSVNMISEATATQRPVWLLDLPVARRRRAAKFRQFHDAMIAAGHLRRFAGRLDHWHQTPPDDTRRAAARVQALLQEKKAPAPPP